MTTTFDAARKGSSVTLSNGNLTATVSSGTGSVGSNTRVSGLTYFEMVVGATLTGSSRIGLYATKFTTSGLLGVDLSGIGYDSGGTVKINNTTVATIATFTTSSNIGVAVDPINRLIWFRVGGGNWNNDVIGNQNPVGAVGGISYDSCAAVMCAAWGGSATSSVTAQFTSASWTYSAPTGFSALDTLQSSATPVSKRPLAYHSEPVFTPGNAGSPSTASVAISGTLTEAGSNVARKVRLYDANTGALLGTTTSNGSTGAFSIPALARSNVYAVAFDPTSYRALVYDQLTPV
jgi:hypothetical protein